MNANIKTERVNNETVFFRSVYGNYNWNIGAFFDKQIIRIVQYKVIH